ncbi:MAG TPA: hypothetical protein VJY35_14635 [Candidatus Eisenbacteria bacterium]|nr:hypothetical protein [Candidatus Eisenbacteria bacterium]
MDKNILAVIVVVGVAALALLMRRFGSRPPDAAAAGGTRIEDELEAASASLPEAYEDDDDEPAEAGALTSDGWAFVPDGDEVQIVPPDSPEEETAEAMGQFGTVMGDAGRVEGMPKRRTPGIAKPGEHLDAGDLTGVRVVRGAPDVDPWRLEALGREGEYRSWSFETEDAARTAMGLLERRIVRVPLGEDGEPSPPADEDYVTALTMMQAGVADLAMDSGDDEPRT